MHHTANDLKSMAHFVSCSGLHTGEQFAARDTHGYPQLDICAIAYWVIEQATPAAFFTDEGTSRDLIEASQRAMDCIRAISAAITNYQVPETGDRPDVIEHVSNWVATPPIGATKPPSISEVVGCILRAANHALNHAPTA